VVVVRINAGTGLRNDSRSCTVRPFALTHHRPSFFPRSL
jgi:hypothetical protein